MIIAVDFDGTLCEECYPEIGDANVRLINMLIRKQQEGDRLILWTCRAGAPLAEAVAWCRQRGLVFDAVNANLPETIIKWGGDSRKVTADVYIDDRSEKPWEMLLEAAV